MTEYIEREALMRRIKEIHCAECDNYHGVRCRACWVDDTLGYIDSEPSSDVSPVVHGRWENGNPICPVCGGNKFRDLDADIWCDWQPDFCPNCGAKMGGVDDG